MTVRVGPIVDENAWNELLRRQRGANIFHTPEMLRVFAAAPAHRPAVWAARDRSGDVVALMPVTEVALAGGRLRSWTTRAIAYGGVLCAADVPDHDIALCRLLTCYAADSAAHALFTELRHVSSASFLHAAMSAAGFRHEPHLNYLISLRQPREQMWCSLSRSARQRVRSAQNKRVQVSEANSAREVDAAYALLDGVYRAVHVPLAGRALFEAARAVLGPLGWFRVVTARLDDRIIAARFLLCYRDRVLDWYAGSDRRFASYSPSELLVWHTLCWAQDAGYRTFDFGGAGRPGTPYGPREFKAKFGGELVDFGRDVLVHAPVRLRVGRTGYTVARRLLWRGPAQAAVSPA